MRTALVIALLAGTLVVAGCKSTCFQQHDELLHDVYYSEPYQCLVAFNDATDGHAVVRTGAYRCWSRAMDCCGADGYYKLHAALNPPCIRPTFTCDRPAYPSVFAPCGPCEEPKPCPPCDACPD